jgi:hypothetical protein
MAQFGKEQADKLMRELRSLRVEGNLQGICTTSGVTTERQQFTRFSKNLHPVLTGHQSCIYAVIFSETLTRILPGFGDFFLVFEGL